MSLRDLFRLSTPPPPPPSAEDRIAGSLFIDGGTVDSTSIQMLPALDSALWARTVDVGVIYKTNPWLTAVVDLIARSYARMPPKVYRTDGDGFDERVSGGRGRRLETTLRTPGRGMSWVRLRKTTARDRLIRGNALWLIHSDDGVTWTGVERIPWRAVSVRETGGEVLYTDTRYTSGDWRAHTYTADRVIHFGLGDSDSGSPVAESRVQSLSSTLALFDAVYTHLISYFGRSARPSAHFAVDPSVSPQVLEQVTQTIRDYYSGPNNAGRILVSSSKFESMQDSPDHSRVIELAKQSREEICGAFGVSPPLVGILDRAIMSNVRELREHVTRDTAGPYIEEMDQDVNAQLAAYWPAYRGVWVQSESAAILKSDIEGSAATYPNQLRIMTPNELRQRKGLKPLDDPEANKLWSPNSGSGSPSADGQQGGQSASSFTAPTPEV